MANKHFIIPIFVPHLGCPHDCVFCNQKKIASQITDIDKCNVKNTINKYLDSFPEGNKTVEVAFYGGSFTGIDLNLQKELLSVPYEYKLKGLIDHIRLSTRPDYIDDKILTVLKNFSVDTIELGVQSLDNEVLDKSGRGHTTNDVERACKLIREYNINLGLQMMVGLPGDTREKALNTARKIVAYKPYCIRIYPTLIVKDTYLEEMYLNKTYYPLSLDQAVDLVTDLLMLFYYYKLDVIRVGLQPTENIQLGKDVVSGPFHPSFRQLVESNILKDIMDQALLENKIINMDSLDIFVNSKNISNVAGQKAKNKKYLKEKFNIKKINIYSKDLGLNEMLISSSDLDIFIDMEKRIEEHLKIKGII